jgi:hypothetical protein
LLRAGLGTGGSDPGIAERERRVTVVVVRTPGGFDTVSVLF